MKNKKVRLKQLSDAIEKGLTQLKEGQKIKAIDVYRRLKNKISKIKKNREKRIIG